MPKRDSPGGRRGGPAAPARPAGPAPGLRALRATLVTVALLSAAAPLAAPPPTLPVSEIEAGMRGVVTTVLTGREPETIELEILGVERDAIGPGIDLVLCRFVDERGRWTGVAAGMSGSPVTVDGRLVGALSYAIGTFSKEPICGITPIDAMLALDELPGGAPPSGASAPAGLARAPLALVAAGLAPGGAEDFADVWSRIGASLGTRVEAPATVGAAASASGAVASAAEARGPASGAELEPGAPVAALLVWGDLKLGASGTVTWRDGDRLLAFGHPFLASGRSETPIAPAEVIWTVPSLLTSFKITNIGEPVGTFTQDRLTAIAGELGDPPEGLPVSVVVRRPERPEVRHAFRVVRDRYLLPALGDLAVRQAVALTLGRERTEALTMTATLRLAEGRALRFFAAGAGDAQGAPSIAIGAEIARRLAQLTLAPYDVPSIEGLEVTVGAVEPGGGWIVARAMPDRLAARPGETVSVTVDLEGPYGLASRETLALELPSDIAPGEYTLLTGSSAALTGELGARPEARRRTARNAEEYLAALEDDASPTRLEAVLARAAEGMVARGRDYLALPSTAHLMLRSRPGGTELYRTRWLALAAARTELDRPVQRIARTRFRVIPEESPR